MAAAPASFGSVALPPPPPAAAKGRGVGAALARYAGGAALLVATGYGLRWLSAFVGERRAARSIERFSGVEGASFSPRRSKTGGGGGGGGEGARGIVGRVIACLSPSNPQFFNGVQVVRRRARADLAGCLALLACAPRVSRLTAQPTHPSPRRRSGRLLRSVYISGATYLPRRAAATHALAQGRVRRRRRARAPSAMRT